MAQGTTKTTAMIHAPPAYIQEAQEHYGKAKLELLRDTIGKNLTVEQFGLFIEVARRSGLDPFARQIYAVSRGGQMTIQTGIDGFRALAERTKLYDGETGPFWCGADGVWRDVWLSKDRPHAAKIEVHRKDFAKPIVGVALMSEFDAGNSMWTKFPSVMLAKCAEAVALRRAFPQELSGIYSSEEMDQAENPATKRLVTTTASLRAAAPAQSKSNDEAQPVESDVVDAEYDDAPKQSAKRPPTLKEQCARFIVDIDACSTEDEVDVVLGSFLEEHAGSKVDGNVRTYASVRLAKLKNAALEIATETRAQKFRDALKDELAAMTSPESEPDADAYAMSDQDEGDR